MLRSFTYLWSLLVGALMGIVGPAQASDLPPVPTEELVQSVSAYGQAAGRAYACNHEVIAAALAREASAHLEVFAPPTEDRSAIKEPDAPFGTWQEIFGNGIHAGITSVVLNGCNLDPWVLSVRNAHDLSRKHAESYASYGLEDINLPDPVVWQRPYNLD
ncbi:MAG: hypothetical protein AAF530_24235 [Pseudomonadota bacterium]